MTLHRSTDTDFDILAADEKRRKLFRFNPEVNSGTIIQIGVIAAGMLFGYSEIKTATALNVARAETIERRATEQEQRTAVTLAEVKSDVKDTGQRVNDLKTKIDLLDLKISQRPAQR